MNQTPNDWELVGITIEPKKKDLVSTARFRHKSGAEISIACPYGKPGDSLWIRETWLKSPVDQAIWYRADNGEDELARIYEYKWKPCIFMFRVMSRLSIEIADIRIERLQSISKGDAIAEGVPPFDWNDGKSLRPIQAYEKLWDSINKKTHPWDSNPFVWVVKFKKS